MHYVLRASLLLFTLLATSATHISAQLPELPGQSSDWHGFRQLDFELDGFACRIVQPHKTADGLPWIWRARFWGHEPQTDIALLQRGFHLAYCDVSNLWGNQVAISRWDRFYEELTCRHGFSPQPALEGMSRGGLIIYQWAIRNPNRVSCIYGDAPVMGLRPYVEGLTEDDPDLDRLKGWLSAHDLSLADAKQYPFDALDHLGALADAGVPLIHVCGDADESVPFEEHTAELQSRYEALGGTIQVIVKRGGKHHPHSLKDPTRIVEFIVRHQPHVQAPLTHGPIVGHVSPRSAIIWARSSQDGVFRLVASSANGRARITVDATADKTTDGCMHWRLQSLSAGTRYSLQILHNNQPLVRGHAHFLVTPPRKSSIPTRLAFASCAREDADSAAVWRRIGHMDPDGIVLLGDTPYIDSVDLAVQRNRYNQFLGIGDFQRLVNHRSLYATWDDHDFGRNDTDGNLPGKEFSRQAFVNHHANPTYGENSKGIYTSFRRGPVEVFLLDTRFFAATESSPYSSPFNGDEPSLLGRQQWAWLLRGLSQSRAPFKILACGMIWNGAVRPGKQDHWGTYPHELEFLFKTIGERGISGVVLVGGDIHRTRMLLHDTMDSAGYRIPELITSPVHSGVIETANTPHPSLVFDAGAPNTFLALSAEGKGRAATLAAQFVTREGSVLHATSFNHGQLSRQSGNSNR